MKKIPTLFVRTEDRRYVTDQVTPGCEWVLAGEGRATRKYDGTCVLIDDDGVCWTRREVKPGKNPPPGWDEVDHDDVTGKRVGWVPFVQSPFESILTDLFCSGRGDDLRPGTYELVGPKINGNPEYFDRHTLVRHGSGLQLLAVPLFYDGLADYLRSLPYEGIVWHHPDGRMVKLKRRDFPS